MRLRTLITVVIGKSVVIYGTCYILSTYFGVA